MFRDSSMVEERKRNFEKALIDELDAEFGKEKHGRASWALEILKMSGELGGIAGPMGKTVPYELLPFVGKPCLESVVSNLFASRQDGKKVLDAFERARGRHLKSGGTQAGTHECVRCSLESKECVAGKMMAMARSAQNGRKADAGKARSAI